MLEKVARILVPVDFSPASLEAVITAHNISRKYTSELYVLHVYQDIFSILSMRTLDLNKDVVSQAMNREVIDELSAFLKKAHIENLAVPVIRKGDAADEILKYAEEISSELIVIATHGRSGLEHFFLGSIAQKIVRYAPCPVLTVRAK